MMTFAIPSFNQFLMRNERNLVINQLKSAIEYARQEAYRRKKTVTLCASSNGKTCLAEDWSLGFIIFEVGSGKQRVPAAQATTLLQVFPAIQYGRLHFASFGDKALNIEPDGTTLNVGTFVYCPKNRDRREAEGLAINKAARAYQLVERNSLGIRLKNSGRSDAAPLICR